VALLDEIGIELQSAGIGTRATDIFEGFQPDSPDNCIALFEYGGSGYDLVVDTEDTRLEALVRNDTYTTGRAKCRDIIEALHGLSNTALSGTNYRIIRALQSPNYLGRDSKNRYEWSINFKIVKDR